MAQKLKNQIVLRKKSVHKRRSKNEKNPRTWKQYFFIFVVVLFVGGVAYMLLGSSLLRVRQFDTQGTKRVDKNNIIKVIEQEINGNIMTYIQKNNYFFVNNNKIVESILADKRIKNVQITKKFPDKMIIEIEEYDKVAIWCTDMTMQTCFVLDGDTVIKQVMMKDAIVTENDHFIIVDETHREVSIGERVMAADYIKKIEALGSELVYVLNVEIKQPSTVASRGSNEVRFMTDEGWYIIVDLAHELDEIFDIAKLFVKKVDLPSRRPDLEYVDMRFPEKIFYKMKEGVEQVEESDEMQKPDDKNAKDEDVD